MVLTSSCSIMRRSGFSPNSTRLELSMNDLEYLGDVEVSVEYSRTLGIFRSVKKINGENYDGVTRNYASASVNCLNAMGDPVLKYAFPKVYESFPDADYVLVVGESSSRDILFLGSEHNVKAKVKVYKLK